MPGTSSNEERPTTQHVPTVSRRQLLGAAGGVLAGAALVETKELRVGPHAASETLSFYGVHQQGITLAPQRHTCFATFDVRTSQRRGLVALLRRWTTTAAALSGTVPHHTDVDGETLGLGLHRLTINVGFGASLFGLGAPDRFGLAARRPAPLLEMPVHDGDAIPPACNGGDLSVQACADDPQVVFHAVRRLARDAGEDASLRWLQTGFNETAVSAGTPRGLLGFKDGTANPTTEQEFDQLVWVQPGTDQDWMAHGTFALFRRIRIDLERWQATPVERQELVIGRHKSSGAPLGGSAEFAVLDFDRRRPDGSSFIPQSAHVRRARPMKPWSSRMLRRSYSYAEGVGDASRRTTSTPGALDVGILFAAYQSDPLVSLLPVLAMVSSRDALHEFTTHTAGALVAIPPAASEPGDWIGRQLLE